MSRMETFRPGPTCTNNCGRYKVFSFRQFHWPGHFVCLPNRQSEFSYSSRFVRSIPNSNCIAWPLWTLNKCLSLEISILGRMRVWCFARVWSFTDCKILAQIRRVSSIFEEKLMSSQCAIENICQTNNVHCDEAIFITWILSLKDGRLDSLCDVSAIAFTSNVKNR